MKILPFSYVTPSDRGRFCPFGVSVIPAVGYDSLAVHLRPKFDPVPVIREKNWGAYGYPYMSSTIVRDECREAAYRLVEAPKSPTDDYFFQKAFFRHKFEFKALIHEQIKNNVLSGRTAAAKYIAADNKNIVPSGTAGAKTIVEYRKWSDEWRIRTAVETSSGSVPEPKTGARISDRLTPGAAKKLGDSSAFMAATRGGYKTLITGTFSNETRSALNAGTTSIQKEVSRSMDALSKMYYRGWTRTDGKKVKGAKVEFVENWEIKHEGMAVAKNSFFDKKQKKLIEYGGEVYSNGKLIEGDYCKVDFVKKKTITKGGFAYCWVVEIPKNKGDGDNPHVHILVDWHVKKIHFQEWASRLEAIWGNGFFHIEKIRKPESAGAYLLKKIGYFTKGTDGSQGIVRGNRYGISEAARAPKFELYSECQLHSMGQLISECYDHISQNFGWMFTDRRKLLETLAKENLSIESREAAKKGLNGIRKKINDMPIKCTRYQVILKGWANASAFFEWAKGETINSDWLPDKLEGELVWVAGERPKSSENLYFTELKRRWQILRIRRRALTDKILQLLSEFNVWKKETNKNNAFSEYENYEIYCNNYVVN